MNNLRPVSLAELIERNDGFLTIMKAEPYPKPLAFNILNIGQFSLSSFSLTDYVREQRNAVIENYSSSSSTHAYVFLLQDVVVHSRAGIMAFPQKNLVIEDTLIHTQPDINHYAINAEGKISLLSRMDARKGCFLSLLMSAVENYFHALVMNFGRLCLLDENLKQRITGVFLPERLGPAQKTAAKKAIFHTLGEVDIIFIREDQSFLCNEVLLPWNVLSHEEGTLHIHPHIIDFWQAVVSFQGSHQSRKIYIDRRNAPTRRLENEEELINALQAQGFEIIQLEHMGFHEQAIVFAQAKLIVAPHGAGLTNLVFAQSGAKLIEIMPDTLLNWCYRDIAAEIGIHYDCVISRSTSTLSNIPPTFATHKVALSHVLSAVDQKL